MRHLPRQVVLATLAFSSFLTLWSFLTPLTKAPDEVTHLDLVLHMATGADYPDYDDRYLGRAAFGLVQSHDQVGVFEPRSRTRDTARLMDLDRTFEESGGDVSMQGLRNQMPQHPPLYYWTTSTVIRVVRQLPGQMSLDHEAHIARFWSVLLMSSLPILSWATTRRLGASAMVATTASFVPLCIPQLAHLGGSINNDNLLIPLCGLTTYFLASVVRGDLRAVTAMKVGAAAGLALMTKGFAMVLPVWIVICYASTIARRQDRSRLLRAVVAIAVAGFTTAAISGRFWVNNLIEHGEISPSIHKTATNVPKGFQPDPLAYFPEFGRLMTERFWGSFGYYEIDLGGLSTWGATALASAALISVFIRRPRRKPWLNSGVTRLQMTVLMSITPLLLAFVALRAYDLYARTGRMSFIQGRYLFGAVVALSAGISLGVWRLADRWAPTAVLVVAIVLQAQGVLLTMRTWWGEPGASVWNSYQALAAWNPWPIPLTSISAIATMVFVIALLIDVIRSARSPVGPERPEAVDLPPEMA